MLGKLLKHEFRATGRVLLPAMGAVLALALLGNLSMRLIQSSSSGFLAVLLGLVIAAFIIGMIALCILTMVIMVLRFYRNLLGHEGYLMHTLPVSVHELVWSKLIVSLVWFLAAGLLVTLLILITVLAQSGTDLGQLLRGFPSVSELREFLAEAGFRHPELRSLWLIAVEGFLAALIGYLGTCLHFYAAMALGQMGSGNKILLSVLFYIVLSMAMSVLVNSAVFGLASNLGQLVEPETLADSLALAQKIVGLGLLLSVLQAALLYLATVLPLQKKLNLG